MTGMWDKKLILAPLAGITEPVYRRICRRFGADIAVSEMVSAEGLVHGGQKTKNLLDFGDDERPIGIQLFGADPESLAYAARFVEEHAGPEFIDLNAGCPVAKVVQKNGGSALLKNPVLFEKIVKAMVGAVRTPVTVKLRSGWAQGDWVDTEFAKIAEQNGAAAICLHPRSRTMGFGGHSFWERIAGVKNVVSIPVIGNGDICTPKDAADMYEQTGCDSIMVGRGAMGYPWLLREIKQKLSGETVQEISPEERLEVALEHLHGYRNMYGEKRASAEIKKHMSWYVKGLPGASALRGSLFRTTSTRELEDTVRQFFASIETAESSTKE